MSEQEFINACNLARVTTAKNIMLEVVETPSIMNSDLDLIITMIRRMESKLHKSVEVDEGVIEPTFLVNSEQDEHSYK